MARVPTPIGKAVCHTPMKVRFASRKDAKRAAATQTHNAGQDIYHYECVCGFWHLTRSKPRKVDEIPTVIGVPHALGLNDSEFTALVDFDIHGRLDEDEAEILRHADIVPRWVATLSTLRVTAEVDLQRINAMVKTPATIGRREAKIKYIAAIERRQQEAKATKKDTSAPHAPKQQQSERKQLRRTAGDRALESLVHRHKIEFTELYYHEASLLGLEFTRPLEEALENIDLERLREFHPAGPAHAVGRPRYPEIHVVLTGDEDFYEIAALAVGAVFRHLRNGEDDAVATFAIIDIVGCLTRVSERNVTDALYALQEWVTIRLPFTTS